jgi:hypothetical protein
MTEGAPFPGSTGQSKRKREHHRDHDCLHAQS